MHEIRISDDLAAIVLETARKENLSEVTGVNISFGQMIQIVPDVFRFAFREAVRGTIAENAEVSIEIIPIKMVCAVCDNECNVEENLFACDKCGSGDLKIINGNELYVTSIEGD